MSIDLAYQVLFGFALLVLTALALACLVRCILGPRISDRVMAINMIGTLTVVMVGLFIVLLSEGYLADIALVYSMISFLAVILLSKVYTGIYQERKHEEELMLQQKAQEEEAKDNA
ncbi:MAG: sodium:proton antiporter [Clostridia bacterium]|nr:sodium:proton antiporter [Clostridia bacterium]